MPTQLTRNVLIAALTLSFIAGCSSVGVRTGENSQLGNPYAGIPYALENNAVCIVVFAAYGTPLTLPFTLTYAAVDIVSTIAADTLLLPVDLLTEAQPTPKTNDRCRISMR